MASVDSIREALPLIGRTVLEITSDDFDPSHKVDVSRIYLHFDDGSTASFPVGENELAFSFDGYPEDHPFSTEDEE